MLLSDGTHKVAARQFPLMIPLNKEDPEAKTNALLRKKLKTFDKPFLEIWGDHQDEMWMGKNKILQAEIPGAAGKDHRVLQTGHFLQEDKAKDIAEIIIGFLGRLDSFSTPILTGHIPSDTITYFKHI